MISVLIANKCQKLLIVVPSDSLRTQLFNKFLICGILKDPRFGVIYQSALNPKVGMLKQTISEVNDLESFFSNCNVVITTMSLINNISSECQEKISELCTHFFIDEAHHAQASSWESFRRRFKNKSIIQFTATPFRNDNQRLEGKIIFNFSLKKAQEQGYFKKINFVPIREYDNLKVDNVFFIPNSNIFSILKSHYKVSLLDSYLSSIDLVQNIDTYRQEWVKEGQDVFKANNKRYRFAKMVVELIEQLKPIQKAL